MAAFRFQEFMILGLYMFEVLQVLKIATQEGTRRIPGELFAINLIIILLDVGLLVMGYRNLSIFELTFKGFTYSVKLKMELAILGKLVFMARSGNQIVFGNEPTCGSDGIMLERPRLYVTGELQMMGCSISNEKRSSRMVEFSMPAGEDSSSI
jgi:hypothetical protein